MGFHWVTSGRLMVWAQPDPSVTHLASWVCDLGVVAANRSVLIIFQTRKGLILRIPVSKMIGNVCTTCPVWCASGPPRSRRIPAVCTPDTILSSQVLALPAEWRPEPPNAMSGNGPRSFPSFNYCHWDLEFPTNGFMQAGSFVCSTDSDVLRL